MLDLVWGETAEPGGEDRTGVPGESPDGAASGFGVAADGGGEPGHQGVEVRGGGVVVVEDVDEFLGCGVDGGAGGSCDGVDGAGQRPGGVPRAAPVEPVLEDPEAEDGRELVFGELRWREAFRGCFVGVVREVAGGVGSADGQGAALEGVGVFAAAAVPGAEGLFGAWWCGAFPVFGGEPAKGGDGVGDGRIVDLQRGGGVVEIAAISDVGGYELQLGFSQMWGQ